MNTETTSAAITEKVTLGQAITFTATYVRRSEGNKRRWQQYSHEDRKGIIVGCRTLWDGEVHTEYFDAEDGGGYHSTFMQDSHKPAFLVAFALNRKPVLVPVADAVAA